MPASTLRRYLEAAEELYSAGHELHAFATLHALLGVPAAISPCYRREETLCRVRAAEMILLLRSPSVQSRRGDATSSTTAAQLDLAQCLLSPMVSSRRYFENAVVCPLLWTNLTCDGAEECVVAVTPKEDVKWEGEWVDDDDDNSHIVPLALVVKAYVLNAIVQRRWLRHGQAVKYLEAAQSWCSSLLVPPACRTSVDYSNDRDALQQEEERRCCEAYLEMELCRVYYSQLMSATTPVAESQNTNTAALHRTCVHALDCLVHYSRNYANYAISEKASRQEQDRRSNEGQRRRRVSALCLSSSRNMFSIRGVARVLGHYYCIALVFSHQLDDAERHMLQCEEIFGSSPEMQCLRRLLAMGYKGPLGNPMSPEVLRIAVKRQRGDKITERNQTVRSCASFQGDFRWISDGLLVALKMYLDLHTATVTVEGATIASTTTTKLPDGTETEGGICNREAGDKSISGGSYISGSDNSSSSSKEVKRLFQSTLQCIDEHMTFLTTTTVCNDSSSKSQMNLLRSSPSSDVRFLVLLKCATLVTMTGYALSQLWVTEGVRCLVQLRRYMAVFHRHTAGLRMHSHLLAAQLSLMISLRHLPGQENAANTAVSDISRQRLSEKEEEENTAGFDVGLPYAHIRAAEMVGIQTPYLRSPSILLLVSLMKGVALYHAARTGSALQLDNSGFTLTRLTVHQRHRCTTAFVNVLEALKTSFCAASLKEEETPMIREKSMQQLCCAWNFSNRLLLLLLRGIASIVEEKDEFNAIRVFTKATKEASWLFGPLSSITAECLQLLAVARKEYEKVQWHIPKDLIFSRSTASVVKHLPIVDVGEGAQNAMPAFSIAWQVALQASRLALLHCVLGVQGGDDLEECMRIIDTWNAEVRHVCLEMRRELVEAVSL